MRAVVVGAGAWGLPAALALADRGHRVTCIDRDGPGNPWSSSSGPTRLWRVADPDPAAIRLGRRAVAALERIEARLGRRVHTRTGLLWRDAPGPLAQITDAVRAEGVEHTEVPAASVGSVFPDSGPTTATPSGSPRPGRRSRRSSSTATPGSSPRPAA